MNVWYLRVGHLVIFQKKQKKKMFLCHNLELGVIFWPEWNFKQNFPGVPQKCWDFGIIDFLSINIIFLEFFSLKTNFGKLTNMFLHKCDEFSNI